MVEDTDFKSRKYAVIVADDLGSSSSVNAAVIEAYKNGMLTCASLMAGGQAFEEAVRMISVCSGLSVGLHVTLCDGRAVLPPSVIPDLADRDGYFEKSPSKAWIRYMRTDVLPQIEAEVEAQFDRLESAGVRPTHVDGHHHIQMLPPVFEVICRQAARRGVGWIRIPREPLTIVLRPRSFSRGLSPVVEWLVFRILRTYNLRMAGRYGINVAGATRGLSWTGRIDEKSLPDLLDNATDQITEIFTHPDIGTESGRRELGALTSINVHNKVSSLGMELVGYRELSREGAANSVWGRI